MIKQFADGSKGFTSLKSAKEFDAILDQFNGFVQKKLYDKFNYESYKRFKRNTYDVRIIGHENSEFLDVIVNGTTYPFQINDYSFGEFLFFHVLTEEESDIIMGQYYNKDYYEYDYSMNTLESSINDMVKELDAKGYYYDYNTGSFVTDSAIANITALETKADSLESASTYITKADSTNAEKFISVDCGTELNSYYTDTNSTKAIINDYWQPVVEISDSFTSKIDELAKACEDLAEKVKPVFDDDDNKKENKDMKFVNFEFGPVTTDKVRMSIYGMAVKNANGEFVAYSDGKIINVDILNFDGSKFMYKIPVAIKDVTVGDVVVHMRKPMIVIEKSSNAFVAVDVYEGEAKTILPTTSPFGFNFMTKIVSLMDMCGGLGTATADAPFGNMLPFLMMNEGTDMDPMMMMLMMGGKMDMSNPMMMYFLMKDGGGKMDDLLPLMLMMGNAGGASLAPTVPAMPATPAVN